MLRVESTKPYKVVYSLCRHEYLGFLIEPHVVQLNPDGDFSLTHQRLFTNTAKEFSAGFDESDFKLVKLLEETEQGHIIKRYYKKAIRPMEFFSKIYDEKLHNTIRPKIEKRIVEALSLLQSKEIYLMSKEGWPVERPLSIAEEPATVLFHFRKNEEETRYFPTIKYQGIRIEFMFKDAQVICNDPAWLLLENVLYFFEGDIEGKKLQPFLNKRYISIPKSAEKTYFERFVAPLIEKHHVYAEGFSINTERFEAIPVLKVIFIPSGTSQLQLYFRYGDYVFSAGSDRKVSVKMEKEKDNYIFHRIKRSIDREKTKLQELLSLGLKTTGGMFVYLETEQKTDEDPAFSVINWLNTHHEELSAGGFIIEQPDGNKRFLFGQSSINLEIQENNDWFDLKAFVRFGPYSIPFLELKHHILNKIREFVLPSGEVAIIPEEWFSQYSNLLSFTEKGHGDLRLKKHHIGLIADFADSELATVTIDRKLQKLSDFHEIEDAPIPVNFKGTLRSYQKAGYNWFHFLRKYNFGGCLADDMGLGKTVQTLALLQKIKEEGDTDGTSSTSLIIMPTSLIYNWLNEAGKFAPGLKILVHTGSFRNKDVERFLQYDVVLTTYGITRVDAELMEHLYFHYIILDESQNIKNPDSKAYKSVKTLKSKHKLILSGTPVENSVNDLWTQMSFINPGLLGNQHFFQNNFVTPIEKKKEEDKARKLQAIIKPFVLRRTKTQVAKELPEKTEQLFYCSMCEEQAEYYEKVKSEYRNELLKTLEDGTFARSQIQVLQGLTKLRQIANHPFMVDNSYEGESGKFENVIHTLENVLAEGHKVLVFSQFVKQLDIYRKYLDNERVPYAYLDGATKNRGEVVEEFQKNSDIKLFLISLKAGGVGLNLTEADYVFMLDPWWNPAVEQQAVDRTHRIGQTKNVFIYKFITKDSVEEKILALQIRKRAVADSLITTEESFVKSLSADDIREILN
ncbi:helicase-like protein [Arcticibacter tournemirensis]|uniref:ATP-dependent helicase n=1 Tax=Arcticibacter tournemirensis TaxID=699437 RepID=A0A4Q0M4X1_9SPHI|nr:SNF2-related protein [Arcticibacter tournemirensis]KAA8479194.1 ATP-dependent helicase [Arcticibacter tournemirensis]RXF68007.1 ATP-dependent helicase [Arcticibacter tournemirensis]TQM48450.1 helicase-like protein [Arcticibacter tournemirensis]